MQPIPARQVEQTWTDVAEMSMDNIPGLIERMSEEQPALLAYLMAAGGDDLGRRDRELLVYVGVVVWHIMANSNAARSEVALELLDEMEQKNQAMFSYLEGESDAGFTETVEKILNNYNQRELLLSVTEALVENQRDTVESNAKIGEIFLYLKTEIDTLDA